MAVIPIPRTNTKGAKPHNPHARGMSFQQKLNNAGRPPFGNQVDDSEDADEVDGNRIGGTFVPATRPVRDNQRENRPSNQSNQMNRGPAPEARVVQPVPPRVLPKPEPIPVVTRVAEFRELFAQKTWLADGASATALFAKGASVNGCVEELNLSLPALVRDLHREYRAAGAHILSTNTFGANKLRLGTHGLSDKLVAINRAGVKIARQAAEESARFVSHEANSEAAATTAFVAGVIGPLGVRMEPLGTLTAEAAQAMFNEQAQALYGVDLFKLETFRDIAELRAAVEGIREAAGGEVVIVAQVSVNDDNTLGDGVAPEVWAPQLDQLNADAIGINCSSGPWAVLETIKKIAPLTTKPLSAFPSAGRPVATSGRLEYPGSVEYFASYVPQFLAVGVRLTGGCCGTTPEHVRQVRVAMEQFDATNAAVVARASAAVAPKAVASAKVVAQKDKSKLAAKIAAGKFVSIIELTASEALGSAGLSEEIENAKQCKKAKVDAISLPVGRSAGGRRNSQASSYRIQEEAAIEAILYLSCRNQTTSSIQGNLLDASALELHNVLCLTGEGSGSLDIDSVGAVTLAGKLNQGLDAGGNALGSSTGFLVGVAANPSAPDADRELQRLEAKVRGGAEYAITPPIFDVESFDAFLKKIEHLKLPVVASILPLTGADHAEFVRNELGVPVPDAIVQRLREGTDGVEIACELASQLRAKAAGLRVVAGSKDVAAALRVLASPAAKSRGKN